MIKEIKYTGLTATPSDYECPDGTIAGTMSLIHEDGAIKPIATPKTIMTTLEGQKVLAIHHTPMHDNYIIGDSSGELYWRCNMEDVENVNLIYNFGSENPVSSAKTIGNTLIVLQVDGTMHYFLWREHDYINLGNALPQLNAAPYLTTEVVETKRLAEISEYDAITPLSHALSGTDYISKDRFVELYEGTISEIKLSGDVRTKIYERVAPIINTYSTILKKYGYFFAPFFVRFAYRLYDDTHVRHTIPILLAPTTWPGGGIPFVRISNSGTAVFAPLFFASRLNANISCPDDWELWKDIITGIDVFVSPPIIDYTDSEEAYTAIKRIQRQADGKWNESPMSMHENKWILTENYGELFVDEGVYHFEPYECPSSDKEEEVKVYAPSLEGYTKCYWVINVTAIGKGKIEVHDANGNAYSAFSEETLKKHNIELPDDGEVYEVFQGRTISYLETGSPLYDFFIFSRGGWSGYIIRGPIDEAMGGRNWYIETKCLDEKSFYDKICDNSQFYKIAELEAGSQHDGEILIKQSTLLSLQTHDTLSDLGQSHNQIKASEALNYNNRLNVIVQSEILTDATSLDIQNPAIFEDAMKISKAYVKIVENSQVAYVEVPMTVPFPYSNNLFYFAYPRSTARELVIILTYSIPELPEKEFRTYDTISLKAHDYLNLAYAFNSFKTLEYIQASTEIVPSGTALDVPGANIIKYGNQIRISSVNNPFYFSEEFTSSFPSKVLSFATAAKALSEGQLGQFPLYAFTDEGVWALEVSSTGTYSAKQPITRDVCISSKSITQLDNAVLFATKRGIMLLSGSQSSCITDILNGKECSLTTIMSNDARDILVDTHGLPNNTDTIPFKDFIADCRMLYDYKGQRIVLYNPNHTYAYVYSMRSKLWGMMPSNFTEPVNAYPDAYVMTSENTLVNVSEHETSNLSSDAVDAKAQYFITRPLKLDAPDLLKTISSIIQRGQFRKGHVKQMLYASRDLIHWTLVWSSTDHYLRGFSGTPYKYFRILVIANLEEGESIDGCSIQYEPRMTNKLR